MPIESEIKDGTGSARKLKIREDHSALVSVTGLPPGSDSAFVLKPYVALMKDANGSSDMLVDGSVNAQDFYIESSSDYDRHILTMSWTIADAGATLNKFGNLAALANGCQIFFQDKELGDVYLHEAVKSNFDLIQVGLFKPAMNSGTSVMRLPNIEGSSEAFVPTLDVRDVFGLPYGMLIPKGSDKRIVFRIRDNVSGMDRFDCRVFGYDVVNGERQ